MYVMYVSNKLSLSNKLLILGGYWKFKRSHHVPSFWIYWQWRHLFTLVHDDVAALAPNLLKYFMILLIWCHGIFSETTIVVHDVVDTLLNVLSKCNCLAIVWFGVLAFEKVNWLVTIIIITSTIIIITSTIIINTWTVEFSHLKR